MKQILLLAKRHISGWAISDLINGKLDDVYKLDEVGSVAQNVLNKELAGSPEGTYVTIDVKVVSPEDK